MNCYDFPPYIACVERVGGRWGIIGKKFAVPKIVLYVLGICAMCLNKQVNKMAVCAHKFPDFVTEGSDVREKQFESLFPIGCVGNFWDSLGNGLVSFGVFGFANARNVNDFRDWLERHCFAGLYRLTGYVWFVLCKFEIRIKNEGVGGNRIDSDCDEMLECILCSRFGRTINRQFLGLIQKMSGDRLQVIPICTLCNEETCKVIGRVITTDRLNFALVPSPKLLSR